MGKLNVSVRFVAVFSCSVSALIWPPSLAALRKQ